MRGGGYGGGGRDAWGAMRKNGLESRVAWIVVLIRKRGCPESRAWVPDALHKLVPLESSAASRESLTLTI